MKITQESKRFTPVTIVLETKEDFLALFIPLGTMTEKKIRQGLSAQCGSESSTNKVDDQVGYCYSALADIFEKGDFS